MAAAGRGLLVSGHDLVASALELKVDELAAKLAALERLRQPADPRVLQTLDVSLQHGERHQSGDDKLLRAEAADIASVGAANAAGAGLKFPYAGHVHAGASASHGIAAHTAHANWKALYTDGSGDEQELALGADGTFLQANGVAAAPSFAALVDGDIPATHSGTSHAGVIATHEAAADPHTGYRLESADH